MLRINWPAFSETVRTWRETNRMTLENAADALCLSHETVRRAERQGHVTTETYLRYCQAMRRDPMEFVK